MDSICGKSNVGKRVFCVNRCSDWVILVGFKRSWWWLVAYAYAEAENCVETRKKVLVLSPAWAPFKTEFLILIGFSTSVWNVPSPASKFHSCRCLPASQGLLLLNQFQLHPPLLPYFQGLSKDRKNKRRWASPEISLKSEGPTHKIMIHLHMNRYNRDGILIFCKARWHNRLGGIKCKALIPWPPANYESLS